MGKDILRKGMNLAVTLVFAFNAIAQAEPVKTDTLRPNAKVNAGVFDLTEDLIDVLDPLKPHFPMTIRDFMADAGYGYQYEVDIIIQEDGRIDFIIYGDLELEASSFNRYKKVVSNIIKQLRKKGYLIEKRKVPGENRVDYYVLFLPHDEDFSIPKPVVHADEAIFMRDIRAKAQQLPNEVCYNMGRSFATLLRESIEDEEIWIPVGGDVRNSTPRIYYYYVRGLLDSGINVFSLGTVPTTTVYFVSDLLKTSGYAVVTGSHNSSEYNGMKQGIFGNNLNSKQAARLKDIFSSGKYRKSRKKGKIVDRPDVLDTYVEFLKVYSLATKEEWEEYILKGDNLKAGIKAILRIHEGERPLKNRKIACDCGNGTVGYLPRKAWVPLGAKVGLLYPKFDGNFPHHIPNPEDPENLKDLQEFVLQYGYEFGFAYDTDVDRIGVVDPKMVTGEDIYCIIAQDILEDNPGATMVVEAKASYTLMEHIQKYGGKVVMSAVGATNIEEAIAKHKAIFGGETSGHVYHRDNDFRDDGLFTASALLKIIAKTGKTIRELLSDVHYYPVSPEFRVFLGVSANKRIIPDLKKMYESKKGYEINCTDGVRIELKDDNGRWLGYFIVRASATEPKLTVRFEGRNEQYFNRMARELFSFLSQYDVVEYGKYSEIANAVLSGKPAIEIIPTPAKSGESQMESGKLTVPPELIEEQAKIEILIEQAA